MRVGEGSGANRILRMQAEFQCNGVAGGDRVEVQDRLRRRQAEFLESAASLL